MLQVWIFGQRVWPPHVDQLLQNAARLYVLPRTHIPRVPSVAQCMLLEHGPRNVLHERHPVYLPVVVRNAVQRRNRIRAGVPAARHP